MATNSMVPYSNPQGNNQTNPGAGTAVSAALPLPGTTPATVTNTAATANPLVPTVPTAAAEGAVNTPINLTGANPAADELNSIFGGGVGGLADQFMGSIQGTDSAVLQEYISSLGPQMATAQAQTNAALGAGGVSSNSSVAAIADSNLQAQETASIAQESASITETGLGMEESMIQGMLAPAENYTNNQAMAPWEILGAGIGAAGTVAGAAMMAP